MKRDLLMRDVVVWHNRLVWVQSATFLKIHHLGKKKRENNSFDENSILPLKYTAIPPFSW